MKSKVNHVVVVCTKYPRDRESVSRSGGAVEKRHRSEAEGDFAFFFPMPLLQKEYRSLVSMHNDQEGIRDPVEMQMSHWKAI